MKNLEPTYFLENGIYTVFFSQVITKTRIKFFVEIKDMFQAVSFEMIAIDGKWRIIHPVQEWVLKLESELVTILNRDFENPSYLMSHLTQSYS